MLVKNPRLPLRNLFFFFVISTSDRGDFPRIIVIALSLLLLTIDLLVDYLFIILKSFFILTYLISNVIIIGRSHRPLGVKGLSVNLLDQDYIVNRYIRSGCTRLTCDYVAPASPQRDMDDDW